MMLAASKRDGCHPDPPVQRSGKKAKASLPASLGSIMLPEKAPRSPGSVLDVTTAEAPAAHVEGTSMLTKPGDKALKKKGDHHSSPMTKASSRVSKPHEPIVPADGFREERLSRLSAEAIEFVRMLKRQYRETVSDRVQVMVDVARVAVMSFGPRGRSTESRSLLH